MVALELLIDASGMERGAQQAQRALDSVSTRAQATERSVISMGRGLNTAFQATGGTIQIAGGIAQTTNALQNLNVAAAGFGAARVFLEVSKTAEDFRSLSITSTKVATDMYGIRTAVAANVTGFAALRAVMAAHPILTIATVISAAAGAMSLFSGSTREAASAFADLVSGAGRIQSLGDVAKYFSDSSLQRTADQRYVESLRDTAAKIYETGTAPTQAELQRILGARTTRDEYHAELLRARGPYSRAVAGGEADIMRLQQLYNQPTTDESLFVLRAFAERNAPDAPVDTRGAESRAAAERSRMMREEAEERRRIQQDQEEAALRAAQELEDSARRTGEAFGDGVADLVLGLRSAREIAASIAQDFVRQGLRSATGALFSAAAGAFNSTSTQTSAAAAPKS